VGEKPLWVKLGNVKDHIDVITAGLAGPFQARDSSAYVISGAFYPLLVP
jgi:hypothetical protein